ncbi:helix-turn-helix transcriptional regulator [Psychromarinibacter sp. C21-152]|uniref:Helix-turn-helix transcriptional regulator n=1 Tax=Psychromarinibacter sediminicola TaxID=3033385 RepID=A0AAE3NWT3_9RHOB|nr:helix-turn-helix transcriptional regulator [Psychromarinibacter sediminicola]MDF0602072.1 helix-turn-helix transcriptional regulator [Psychromarinibacter sediminicola]
MSSTARMIDACLETLGSEGFAPVFADFVETLGVDQIMVFAISADAARCLFSRHFANAALAGDLAAAYLEGGYRDDPLLPALKDAPRDSVEMHRLEDMATRMDADYRHRFFDAPGLSAKTTVIAVGDTLRLFVSFYAADAVRDACNPDLARLAGRLTLMHFERAFDTGVPAPLTVLSDRERAVCLGILSGQKSEAIAADLGVAASSVITYRKRAYGKLGVTSRAGLFAICST